MLDLAAVAEDHLLPRTLANLDYRGILDVEALRSLCRRGTPGSAHLRWALREHQPLPARANGRLEADFLAWCERFQVPLPRVNVRLHGVLVDAYWPEQRLVVELDGVANHWGTAQLHREPERMYRELISHLRRTL